MKRNKMLHNIAITLIAIFFFSCGTKKMSSVDQNDLSEMLKSGKHIYIKDKVFKNEVDFTSFLSETPISQGVSQITINSLLTFDNCTFKKEVLASNKKNQDICVTTFYGNVSFLKCTFEEQVDFKGASFYGRVDFSNSTFQKKANFEETTYFQDSYFNHCVFNKELRFQNSFFIKKVNFMNTEYLDVVFYQNATFNTEAQFSVTKFHKYADFSLTDYRDHVFFNYAIFFERADFSNAYFGKNLYYNHTQNKQTNFSGVKFMGSISFENTKADNAINFESTFFLFKKPNFDFKTINY